MNKLTTSAFQIKKLVILAIITTVIALFPVPKTIAAETYGRDAYGSGKYSAGDETTPSNPSNSSSSTSENDDKNDDTCRDDEAGIQPAWIYAAESGSMTSVTLLFNEAADPVDTYELKYGTNPDSLDLSIDKLGIKSKSKMKYTVENLNPNTTYYFRIRGNNGCAKGSWSNIIQGKTKSKSTTSYKQLTFVNSKLEPTNPLDGPVTSTVNENEENEIISPIGPDETNENTLSDAYKLRVKILDENSTPIENAKVTIYPEKMESATDKEGFVIFEKLNGGDHTITVNSNGYEGSESINLTGTVKDQTLTIQVKPTNKLFSPTVLWTITIFLITTFIAFFLFLKYKRK